MTEFLAGVVAVVVSIIGAYIAGRRAAGRDQKAEDAQRRLNTREKIDGAERFFDPDAARAAMRVRKNADKR